MEIIYSEFFKKRFQKLPQKIQIKFGEKIKIFLQDQNSPLLRPHPLKGPLAGYRAFCLTGDYRVIYKIISSDMIKLIDIGTHNQVY